MSPTRVTLDSPSLAARRRQVARQAERDQRRTAYRTRMYEQPMVAQGGMHGGEPRGAANPAVAEVAIAQATLRSEVNANSVVRQAANSAQTNQDTAPLELVIEEPHESVLTKQFQTASRVGKLPAGARVPRNIVGKAFNYAANLPYVIRHRTRRGKLVVNVLSLSCILLGVFAIIQQSRHNNDVVAISQEKANQSVAAVAAPVAAPVEKPKPKPITYAPNQPKRLKIGAISVNAPMIQLGTARDGSIDTPYDVSIVGWYNKSVHPGEAGAMIFDGHVGQPGYKGVFANLKNLKKGDTMEVEQGDGQKFTYQVVETRRYDQSSADRDEMFLAINNKPGLNIITCDGDYDKKAQTYSHRIVVYAELQG